jgi:hypothetical protein
MISNQDAKVKDCDTRQACDETISDYWCHNSQSWLLVLLASFWLFEHDEELSTGVMIE